MNSVKSVAPLLFRKDIDREIRISRGSRSLSILFGILREIGHAP
jgi:hypothetical protein